MQLCVGLVRLSHELCGSMIKDIALLLVAMVGIIDYVKP